MVQLVEAHKLLAAPLTIGAWIRGGRRYARTAQPQLPHVRSMSARVAASARTRGLRVDCWAAPHALPAPTPQESAQNARNARGCGLRSFHEPFHGIPGQAREIRHSK
jgi:hypothetical protein